jgi:putative membrane protein
MYGWLGGHGFMWVFNMIIWFGIIAFVVYILFNTAKSTKDNKDLSPEEIIKLRYAKGEITRSEYEEMISKIGENR